MRAATTEAAESPRSTRHSSVLREAKKNLRRHFSFVGISERFDETLLLLGRTLGWRHVYYRPKLVNKNKPDKGNVLPVLKAVWLASDDSDYIHGASIFVDGGMTLYPGFETGG